MKNKILAATKKKSKINFRKNNDNFAIKYENVSFTYGKKTMFAKQAINNISYEFLKNKIIAIIGNTGSGKSTIIMHANGLLIPDTGTINIYNEHLIQAKQRRIKDYKMIRRKVGIVFQFPENQLFEETVLKDIMFGPLNLGFKEIEATKMAKATLKTVRISEKLLSNSPFELSGGQKRRVAIAGILAMDPDLLIFDEPTAGLDPAGEKEVCDLFTTLKNKKKKTVIFVSHDMQLVLSTADVVLVIDDGKILISEEPFKMFYDQNVLNKFHMISPYVVKIIKLLKNINNNLYHYLLSSNIRTMPELAVHLKRWKNKNESR